MKSNRVLSRALLVAAAVLAGCAGVAPDTLKPVKEARTIEVAQNVRWKYDSGLGLGHWEYLLVAGSYQATVEDDSGVYYFGPKPSCLFQTAIVDAKPHYGNSLECAIYVPHAAKDSPRLFRINNPPRPQTEFEADNTPVIERRGSRGHSSNGTSEIDTTAIATTAVPRAGPMAAGIGGAIGAGIVDAVADAERGRLMEFNKQPPAGWLRQGSSMR